MVLIRTFITFEFKEHFTINAHLYHHEILENLQSNLALILPNLCTHYFSVLKHILQTLSKIPEFLKSIVFWLDV